MYSILLEGNIFKHNSSHIERPIVQIYMDGTDEFYLDGESKRSMIMLNNTFENNGSHGKGVFYIGYMLNVDILDGNVF